MRNICESCKNKIILNQIKTSTCKICSKVITSVVSPSDVICIDCSEEYNKCVRCGETIKE